jgi:hypothetical protein
LEMKNEEWRRKKSGERPRKRARSAF